VRVAVSDLI
jgi:hypothetical protein